jgi:hypothetical protein
VERVCDGPLEQGDYLFSSREQALIAATGEDPALGQLAAWTAKEATWKALWPYQPHHPAAVELIHLDLSAGDAVTSCPNESPGGAIQVTVSPGEGPDGDYLLALARLNHKE